jgi:transcriptional regulator with XRE-family HTH domain
MDSVDALTGRAIDSFRASLREALQDKGLTQTQLAEGLGVSKARVSQILSGRNVTLRTMVRTLSLVDRRLVIGAEEESGEDVSAS